MSPSSRDEELEPKSSWTEQICYHGPSKSFGDEETDPLLAGSSTSFECARRLSTHTLDLAFGIPADNSHFENSDQLISYHSSDEPYFFDFIMEKVRSTKFAYWANKLAVESEPGLTNAQLMLHNHDLKPGRSFVFPRLSKFTDERINS